MNKMDVNVNNRYPIEQKIIAAQSARQYIEATVEFAEHKKNQCITNPAQAAIINLQI